MNVQYGIKPRMPWCHDQNIRLLERKLNNTKNSAVHKHRVNKKAATTTPSLPSNCKNTIQHPSMKSQYLEGRRQLNLCFFSRFPQSLESHAVLGQVNTTLDGGKNSTQNKSFTRTIWIWSIAEFSDTIFKSISSCSLYMDEGNEQKRSQKSQKALSAFSTVYTTQVNSAFRAIWLVPQSRTMKYYSAPGGFRRKKIARKTHFFRK